MFSKKERTGRKRKRKEEKETQISEIALISYQKSSFLNRPRPGEERE